MAGVPKFILYICIYVCVNTHTHAHIHTHIHIHRYIYIETCLYWCTYVSILIHVHTSNIYFCIHMSYIYSTYTCKNTLTRMYTMCMCAEVQTHQYMYIFECVCMCIIHKIKKKGRWLSTDMRPRYSERWEESSFYIIKNQDGSYLDCIMIKGIVAIYVSSPLYVWQSGLTSLSLPLSLALSPSLSPTLSSLPLDLSPANLTTR